MPILPILNIFLQQGFSICFAFLKFFLLDPINAPKLPFFACKLPPDIGAST